MDFRYMGFHHEENRRVYTFDGTSGPTPHVQHTVSVDVSLFLKHHIGIQEGPALCARKLTADLAEQGDEPPNAGHVLTNEDLLAFSAGQRAAQERKAESRRRPIRRPAGA